MREISPVGLLLDVDGPVASTETRSVPPQIVASLVRLLAAGVPVCFNTGRSADFILHTVLTPLREAGLPSGAPAFAVCEKGAVWFPFSAVPAGDLPRVAHDDGTPPWVRTSPAMAVPERLRDVVGTANAELAGGLQFEDHTKLAMISLEKEIEADTAEYERARDAVAARVEQLLTEAGLAQEYEVEATVISVDVQHVDSGKALGAAHTLEMMAQARVQLPARWFTAGDSRSDYAMADWLHARGARVEHVDVRPADGVPQTPYPVLTAADLAERGHGRADDVHEATGASLLAWVEQELLGR
jgi:hypothetical protein